MRIVAAYTDMYKYLDPRRSRFRTTFIIFMLRLISFQNKRKLHYKLIILECKQCQHAHQHKYAHATWTEKQDKGKRSKKQQKCPLIIIANDTSCGVITLSFKWIACVLQSLTHCWDQKLASDIHTPIANTIFCLHLLCSTQQQQV